MTDRYDSPEHKIEEVIEITGGDPRKLAIAYLRAQKRARDAETAFDVLAGISSAYVHATHGDGQGAIDEIEKTRRKLHQHKDMTDTEQQQKARP